MTKARWFVCERQPKWIAEIRHRFDQPPRIYELRSAKMCFLLLERFPASVVVWEVDAVAHFDGLLECLVRQQRRFPESCPLVVGSRRQAAWQWVLREAGAVHAVFSPRHLPQIIELAQRHLKRLEPPRSLATQILQNMPWPAAATPAFLDQLRPESDGEVPSSDANPG